MHTAVVRKRERAAASSRKRKRGTANSNRTADSTAADGEDDGDEAFRTGAEIKRSGGRESSGRLAGQKRKQYEEGDVEGMEDEQDELADEDMVSGRKGRGRREEEEEVEFRWRIEKILAERQRVVKMDVEGAPILDSSDSESDDDDTANDPSNASFPSPRKLRLPPRALHRPRPRRQPH